MLHHIKSNVKKWTSAHNKKLTMCKKCYTFYYKNSWHFYKPAHIDLSRDQEIPVQFTDCPACIEEESFAYSGTDSDLTLARG